MSLLVTRWRPSLGCCGFGWRPPLLHSEGGRSMDTLGALKARRGCGLLRQTIHLHTHPLDSRNMVHKRVNLWNLFGFQVSVFNCLAENMDNSFVSFSNLFQNSDI